MILLIFILFGFTGVIIYLIFNMFISETKKAAKDAIVFANSEEANKPLKWWQIILGFLFAFFCIYLFMKYDI